MADQATEAPAAVTDDAQDKPTDQPHPTTEAPPTTDGTSAGPGHEPEYFSDNFDPDTLDEALRPAYKGMHGAFTRKTMELAEQRKEAEAAAQFVAALQSEDHRQDALKQMADAIGPEQILEALGYTTEEDEPLDDNLEHLDPTERMVREWEEFKTRQQTEREQAAQTAQEQEWNTYVDSVDEAVETTLRELAAEHGELDDAETEFLIGRTLAAGQTDGRPPTPEQVSAELRKSFDLLTGAYDKRSQKWAKSKETTHTAPDGQAAGEGEPDLINMTTQQRIDFARRRLAEKGAEPAV